MRKPLCENRPGRPNGKVWIYQIDRSEKIEQTQVDTIIAMANDKNYVVVLKAKSKRLIWEVFKDSGRKELFPYLVFAALLALLIKKAGITGQLIIDREYFGHDALIYNRIKEHLDLLGVTKPELVFGHVGKQSRPHQLAARVSHGKEKAQRIVNDAEALQLLLAIKKDWESRRPGTKGA